MPTLASRVAFAEKHITSPDGQPFSLTGRSWVLDHLWRPLDGWKLWPEDPDHLCAKCAPLANTIVEDYHAADKTRTPEHDRSGCSGLRSEPVLIVAANLKRQSGKTFNAASWALTQACMCDRESIALLAGSEDQVARLFLKNYKRPIESDHKLSKLCRVMTNQIRVDKRESDIEILPTALTSVGDTRTAVIIDECREVPASIGPALVATLFARGGWECPTRLRNHTRTHAGVDDPKAPATCGVCEAVLGREGVRLQPWFGRALLMSSAGELRDNDGDWFHEFVTAYSEKPHPNVHVFISTETLNPKSSRKVMSATSEVFGALDSTRTYAGIETGNEFLRKGQQFMTAADVRACDDPALKNLEATDAPCVGFLDTSDTFDKTSLVILAAEGDEKSPWQRVAQVRLDFWIPAELPGRVIDCDKVEAHLISLLKTFRNMRHFNVDTRGSRRWGEFVSKIRNTFPVVKRWVDAKGEGRDSWEILYQRMSQRPVTGIRLQQCKEQDREFAGIRWKAGARDDRPRVVDVDRRKSHRDITEALACACYLADLELHRSARASIGRRTSAGKDNRSATQKMRDRQADIQARIAGATFGVNGY